jgi:hypothetical protein
MGTASIIGGTDFIAQTLCAITAVITAVAGVVEWRSPDTSKWHKGARLVAVVAGILTAIFAIVTLITGCFLSKSQEQQFTTAQETVRNQSNQIERLQQQVKKQDLWGKDEHGDVYPK